MVLWHQSCLNFIPSVCFTYACPQILAVRSQAFLAEESNHSHVSQYDHSLCDWDAPRCRVRARRATTSLFADSGASPRSPRSRRTLDPPRNYRRYACKLHTSLHAALARTLRASQQPCRATQKLALTMPARPSSHLARCWSRRARSCRHAHSPRSTASSWTAW